MPSSEMLARVLAFQPDLHAVAGTRSDTARVYTAPNWRGSIGWVESPLARCASCFESSHRFISSMTDHFCGGCSRLRIAADGRFKVGYIRHRKLTEPDLFVDRSASLDRPSCLCERCCDQAHRTLTCCTSLARQSRARSLRTTANQVCLPPMKPNML